MRGRCDELDRADWRNEIVAQDRRIRCFGGSGTRVRHRQPGVVGLSAQPAELPGTATSVAGAATAPAGAAAASAAIRAPARGTGADCAGPRVSACAHRLGTGDRRGAAAVRLGRDHVVARRGPSGQGSSCRGLCLSRPNLCPVPRRPLPVAGRHVLSALWDRRLPAARVHRQCLSGCRLDRLWACRAAAGLRVGPLRARYAAGQPRHRPDL